MIVGNLKDLPKKELISDAVKDVTMQVLVSPEEGWDSHVMRVLELGIDGYSPKHQHPWPHINYIIEGEGVLMIDGKDYPITAGSYAYVPQDTLHQFKNVGTTQFKFICIVPTAGHTY